MLSLSAGVLAAQKAGGNAIWKVDFTKSGFTTRTYGFDTTNRVLNITHSKNDWLEEAEVTVDNRDGNLTALNLIGYQAIISYGYDSTYYATSRLKVISQRFGSGYGDLTCIFSLAGKGNQMAEDKSSGVLKKGTATSTSASKLVSTNVAFVSSDLGKPVHNTTDNTWAKITEFISATQVALDADIMVSGEAFSVMGDYEPASDNTDKVETILTAIAQATLACFSHCESITLTWELTTYQDDELANKFVPADDFKVYKGQSRLDKIKEVLAYTGLDGRIEGDGAIHIFQTFAREWAANTGTDQNEIIKPTVPSDWAANTTYSLNARRKPTTQNGFYYVCSTAGTSHATTEPTWTTQDGLTVDDGTVTWTCRDTDYVYTCISQQGVTGSSEPVWPYARWEEIADSGVVWALKYDYDYSDV